VLAITFILVSVAFITVGNAQIETISVDSNNDKIVKPENPANNSPLRNCSLVIKLPANSVTMMVQHTSTNSYFNTTLSDVPLGYDISNGSYLGWCIDLCHRIADNIFYQVYLYSSYNTSMPSYLWHNNLSKVNYILNNKFILLILRESGKKHNLYYLISEKPFCITHRREALGRLGIHNFILDLSLYPATSSEGCGHDRRSDAERTCSANWWA